MKLEYVYVFNGNHSSFASAIFITKELAFDWITLNKLSGILNVYPLNVSLHDWAIQQDFFKPKTEYQKQATFIQNFSTAFMEHYHFENGELA
jgi:hypothetical protein